MNLTIRPVDLEADRDILLNFHCRGNYESASPWARRMEYEEYRKKWLSTSQPESFLQSLAKSLEDERTITEIWEDEDKAVAYVWIAFWDIPDYNITVAEVNDIAVANAYQRRGIATQMLAHAEQLARERGAHVFRSGTGIENLASQRLHAKQGFETYHVLYEKLLVDDPTRNWTRGSSNS
jgi:GNAT superfamily N-acetyltransferase